MYNIVAAVIIFCHVIPSVIAGYLDPDMNFQVWRVSLLSINLLQSIFIFYVLDNRKKYTQILFGSIVVVSAYFLIAYLYISHVDDLIFNPLYRLLGHG